MILGRGSEIWGSGGSYCTGLVFCKKSLTNIGSFVVLQLGLKMQNTKF